MNNEFKGTLDYIFTSNHWNVKDVKSIKNGGPYPDEDEPSDHVMISADLQLVRR